MPFHRLTLRVLVALATSLSLLHPTVEGGGIPCSAGRSESTQGAMATGGAGSHADHGVAGSTVRERSEAAQQHSDHRAPAPERCCESASGCSVTTVAAVVERAPVQSSANGIPVHSDVMLASVGTAPEPPPPKA